jgi:CBS domain-containing protein
MTLGEICKKDIVTADRETTVRDAAKLMREHHVGNVVVVDGKKPVGIVTDRDIVVGVLATGLDAEALTTGEIMGPGLTLGHVDDDVSTIVHRMSREGIRRMPVVGEGGELEGMFALDDYLRVLASQMHDVSRLIAREQKREAETRLALSAR